MTVSPAVIKMNRQFASVFIVCVFAAVFAPSLGAQQSPAEEAAVTGTVTAPNGVLFNGAQLLIKSGDRRIPIRTDATGNFAIRLVPGIYTVSVRTDGFCESHRGAFSLKPGAHAKFDFELTVCGTMDPFFPGHRAEDPYPELPRARQPGEYGDEELKAIGPEGLRPLVMYGDRQESAESITYTPLVLHEFQDKRLPVVYTYDLLTIRSDHLIYFPKVNSIEASGNVVWQDGPETHRGSKLNLSFRDGEPIVSLTK